MIPQIFGNSQNLGLGPSLDPKPYYKDPKIGFRILFFSRLAKGLGHCKQGGGTERPTNGRTPWDLIIEGLG